ncbi:MAG: 2-oxoglutarate and iron-dependent oxygenase domain-containing protein [Aliishimia sp.]
MGHEEIPAIDLLALKDRAPNALAAMRIAATQTGFATVYNTALSGARVRDVIETYRKFFHLPSAEKEKFNMATTGSNRGWGRPGSEQVNPDANPDFKQYFDCGLTLPEGHALTKMPVYAPNLWPDTPSDFSDVVSTYYEEARGVAMGVLRALSVSLGRPEDAFDAAFETPMALLRGNYYPTRPDWATDKDFGIATHTDYGCLTLLATDGAPGLEVRKRGGGWIPVQAEPGHFVINFGEMMQFWTGGDVLATPHRVIGTTHERISIPMFFNPSHDINVAPPGSDQVIQAGDHLAKRFNETYAHLKTG